MSAALAQTTMTLPSRPDEVQQVPGGSASPAVRLRQPSRQPTSRQLPSRADPALDPFDPAPLVRRSGIELPPDEFERFVSALAGYGPDGKPVEIRRFGRALQGAAGDDALEIAESAPSALVPPEYVLQPGDEVSVALWGSVDANLTVVVDNTGRITLPRVGGIVVAGSRFSELQEVVRRRVAQTFKNFDVSVSMGQLRAMRVFVTGFVTRPGAYTVPALSTLSQALIRAGGPASAGSFRNIVLRRKGRPDVAFDFYDLLVRGQRASDATLQPDDVVHVGAVGPQVGIIGSVNRAAIFEIRPGEDVGAVVAMAGGLSPVADARRLTLERLEDRETVRVVELKLPADASRPLDRGDVVRAVSAVSATGSQLSKNKRVVVEGEVLRPGVHVLPPGSTLLDALQAAGGLTSNAYVYGTELNRESVRIGQQENYERALRDVETEFARTAAGQRATSAEDATNQALRAASTTRLIDRLRALRPNGRVVLELQPEASELPPLLLEDGDRLLIPSRPTSVGVFGSVFSTGNYLYGRGRSLGDYVRLAGGTTRSADRSSVFVIRANGVVVSSLQSSSWFRTSSSSFDNEPALPGDTIFVPEEINKTTFVQNVKDWTQILYQFGLGVAALKTIAP